MAREFAKKFYRSKEWENVRNYILRRDKYICQICGKPAELVHHKQHLTPANIYDLSVNLNEDNLVSICRDCHFKEHEEEIKAALEKGKQEAKGKPREYKNKTEREKGFYFDDNGYLQERK